MSIDTASLRPGNYQAAFFLIDPAAPNNFSQAKLPVGFSIDGDVLTDLTHYYAAQPVLDAVPSPVPINFYLTLTGSPGSSDYFLMAIRTQDGILAAPDGNQWLLWAAMDQDSPVLNEDMPGGMSSSVAQVPEPSAMLMLACVGAWLLMRPGRRNAIAMDGRKWK